VAELDELLHVPVKDALRQLVQSGRLHRQEFEEHYLYLGNERGRRQEQWANRQAIQPAIDSREQEFRAARALLFGLLDEQQRRLFAGLESFKLGHGGDRELAQALGLDDETVDRGRRELLAGKVDHNRVRRLGGGQ
jgi:hypothetical protein